VIIWIGAVIAAAKTILNLPYKFGTGFLCPHQGNWKLRFANVSNLNSNDLCETLNDPGDYHQNNGPLPETIIRMVLMTANRVQGKHFVAAAWRLTCLSILIGVVCGTTAYCNNIAVTYVTTMGQDTGTDTVLVQFDLAWENSWRNPIKRDAAWLFVKYRNPAMTGDWAHATLSSTSPVHTAPAGSTIDAVPGGTGVFIYRSATGTGNVNFGGVQLLWNYGADGVGDNDWVDVDVLAIEMVHVPTGAFAAGSGGQESFPFTLTTINTADATVAPGGSGSLGGQAGGYPTGQDAPDNASWPNGFSAFYCMKYEISQGQYTDFLNSLTAAQAGNRFPDVNGMDRHTIDGSHPNFTAAVPDRAGNYLSWADGAAYADWSGLRPMTELEYEKACRGTKAPVQDEYAWGTTGIYSAHYTLANDGTPMAQISDMGTGLGNVSYTQTAANYNGPLRCGIFAASVVTLDRVETGASFYGIMELSGNLCERPVTIGNATGRAFTGNHGDGDLNPEGFMNVGGWPNESGNGGGLRGGAYQRDVGELRVSDRKQAMAGVWARISYYGFRGVRSAEPAP